LNLFVLMKLPKASSLNLNNIRDVNMANQPPISLIHQVEDRLVQELSRVTRSRIPEICDQLEAMGDRQSRPLDRQALFSASAMLRVRLASAGAMPDLMASRKARSTRASLIEDSERRAIVLLDEDDLQTQILAQDLSSAIIAESGEEYPAYLQMLGEISPQSWKDEEINPFAAKSIASILIQALNTPSDSSIVKSALRGLTVKVFAPEVTKVITALIKQMLEGGVTPSVGFVIKKSESNASVTKIDVAHAMAISGAIKPTVQTANAEAAYIGEDSSSAASDGRSGEAIQAVYSSDWLGKSAFAKVSDAPKLAKALVLQPVVEIERDAVAFAHSVGVMPYSRQARAEFFSKNRQRLKAVEASAGQLATLDVVAAMFDYVVDETRLPESVKPLFWRLQQPALALSLLDPSYLSEDSRSLRKLIENFGAISTAFAEEITRGSELHRRLETVVRAVEIVTSSLQSRSAVMATQVDKEYQKAAKSVTQLVEKVARERSALESTPQRSNRRDYAGRPSKERERNVTENISRSLDERFSHFDVPESVKDFLTTVWVRQLRTAALRDGEDSAEYKVAMQVVDDLLWSLNSDRRAQSRKELAERIPPLIRLLTDGVKRVGAKEEEQKAFFDELFLVHLRKMSKRSNTKTKTAVRPEDVIIPSEIVSQMGARSLARRSEPRVAKLDALETSMLSVPKLDEPLDTLIGAKTNTRTPGTLREMEALARGKSLGETKPVTETLSPISIPRFAANTTPFPKTKTKTEAKSPSTRVNPISRSFDSRMDLERELVAPTHLRVVSRQDSLGHEDEGSLLKRETLDRPILTELTSNDPNTRLPVAPTRGSSAPVPVPQAQQPDSEKVLTEDDSAQLFEVMNAVDLSDCPPEQASLDLAPEAAIDAINKDSWIRLTSRDGEVSMFKVAWLNQSRSLALLVRFPDRRALSLRFADLRTRLEEGHAALMSLPEA
jgi:Protein of unknown function (DUF1631)